MSGIFGASVAYARLMAAAYSLTGKGLRPPVNEIPGLWPGNFLWEGRWLNAHDAGPFGLVRSDTYSGFLASDPTSGAGLVVIIGTHTPLEWFEDFEASPIKYSIEGFSFEKGFVDFYQNLSVEPDGIPLHILLSQSKCEWTIVGHSLGASGAAIATLDCPQKRRLLAFAMPKFSDIEASTLVREKTTAIVFRNVQDAVPMAPPLPIYQSVLPEAWFNSDTIGVSGDIGDRHGMQTCYLKMCELDAIGAIALSVDT